MTASGLYRLFYAGEGEGDPSVFLESNNFDDFLIDGVVEGVDESGEIVLALFHDDHFFDLVFFDDLVDLHDVGVREEGPEGF